MPINLSAVDGENLKKLLNAEKKQSTSTQPTFSIQEVPGENNRVVLERTDVDGKKNTPQILRFINMDIFPQKPYSQWRFNEGDARLLNIAWIKDDFGKTMRLIYPSPEDEKTFGDDEMPIVKFINQVKLKKSTKQENGKYKAIEIYANREDKGLMENNADYPTIASIYRKIVGLDEVSATNRFPTGWVGSKVAIMNVIDRSDMEYHRKSKLLKLLVRSGNFTTPDISKRYWKELSAFSIRGPLAKLATESKYGEEFYKYDIAIKYEAKSSVNQFATTLVRDASSPAKVGYTQELEALGFDTSIISTNDFLTEEELQWNPVDIDKLYKVTSYRTIIKRLGKTIKMFDDMVGTSFYSQCKNLADEEERLIQFEKENSTSKNEVVEVTANDINQISEETPKRMTRGVITQEPQKTGVDMFIDIFKNLKGWNQLSDEEKSALDIDASVKDENGIIIEPRFNNISDDNPLVACEGLGPEGNLGCGCNNPLSFTRCIKCGISYVD